MKKNKDKNSSVFLEGNNNKDDSLEKDISQSIDIVNRNREELDDERKNRINRFERSASGQLIERQEIRYKISPKVIISIIIAIILIIWGLIEYGPILGIHIKPVGHDINDSKIELVTKENDIYGEYNNHLFVFSNNTLTTYDNDCNVTWTYTFVESFTPKIYVKDKYMLVTNNSTGMMYLFEKENEILNKKIDGTIKNAFIDKYGNMAIEYSASSGYNNMISVFDKQGTNLYDVYLNQEVVLSLQLLDNAQRMVLCESVTDSASIGVKFKEININRNKEEQLRDIITLDNHFAFKFFVDRDDIYALLDDQIVRINISSGQDYILKEFNKNQLIFVDINDNYYSLLQKSDNSDVYVSENVGYAGNSISRTEIDSLPKNMISTDIVNYYIYQDHISIINKWGVDLGSREISFTPKKCVTFNKNKSIALIYTNKIYIVNL